MVRPCRAVSRRTLLSAATAVPAAAVLFGCTGGGSEAATGDPVPVRVLTGLGFQGREAYLYVAEAMGWFAEAGLSVEVLPGEATEGNLTLLAGGQAEFATLDVSAALIAYSSGTFPDFALTAILHELNLSCVMVLESSPIRVLSDLEGRAVAAIPGGVNTVVLPLLGELAGFDASSVRVVPLAPPNPQTFGSALAEGRVDAIMQFVVGQPAIEAVSGGPVRVLPYSDWITDMYGSGIGVSAELARRDPQLVRRFNAAAIRGLEHAIAYPDEAGEMFAAAHEQHDPQAAAAEVRALAPYVRPSSGVQGPLQQGEISPVRLAQNIAVLEALGAVGPGIASEDVAVFGLAR